MSFYDVKEQIFDIILTEKGKEYYINGVFSPVYYSFSDKDINYNDTDTYEGILAGLNNRISFTPRFLNKNLQECIIGNSELNNENFPSFSLKVLNGIIDQNTIIREADNDLSKNLYTVYIEQEDRFDFDGLFMATNNSILIDLKELNSIFHSKNFTIEISKLNENDEEEELQFISREFFDNIITSSFVNENSNEITIFEDHPVVTPKNVEYYLEILVDKEIINDYSYINGLEEEELQENIDEEIVNC